MKMLLNLIRSFNGCFNDILMVIHSVVITEFINDSNMLHTINYLLSLAYY